MYLFIKIEVLKDTRGKWRRGRLQFKSYHPNRNTIEIKGNHERNADDKNN